MLKDIIKKAKDKFEDKFCNNHGKIRFLRGIFFNDEDAIEKIEQFMSQQIETAIKTAFEEVMPKEKFCEYCDDKSVQNIQINIKKFLKK